MGREVLRLRSCAPLILLATLGCREREGGPQPKNRAEATELEKQGHSFAARTRPDWVDVPRGAARPAPFMPAGWAQAGRGTFLLGRLGGRRTHSLAELAVNALEGKRVRVHAPIRTCAGQKTFGVLEDTGQTLVVLLPGELPEGVAGQRAVVEGELRRATGKEREAAERCLGKKASAPLVAQASGVLLHVPGGR